MASNFNDTTPAAPVGTTNVAWQKDGSGNISANVPTSPAIANAVDLTAQTANISATNLIASPANAVYRISSYIIVTTPDGASSTLPSIVISWTDQDNAQAQTLTLTPSSPTGNTTTTFGEFVATISASSAAAIKYATTSYASGTPATMQYALHLRIEQL